MLAWKEFPQGIYAFDAGYVRPILAAIHMVVENGRVAFVDTGTNDSLPRTRMALDELGLTPEAVDYVILTHIHLDHAGGAGTMMQAFPNAQLVVHEKGARHMADPSKLVAGVTAVYGAEYVGKMYGTILPVAKERIIAAGHGHVVDLAGRELICLDTPGHAKHHLCIWDDKSGGVFTGDAFGLSYREMDRGGRQFIFPSTSPSQFDPEAMRASIELVLEKEPEALYFTHYSRVENPAKVGDFLQRMINTHVAIALREQQAGEQRHTRIRAALERLLLDEARSFGCHMEKEQLLALWATDVELNAQGLGVWLDSLQD